MDDKSSPRGGRPPQASSVHIQKRPELEGARVLILTGPFAGREGVCLGKEESGPTWAVSPDATSRILSLAFDKDFALVVDLSSDPNRN
jgi:hypothetical protein